MNLIVYIILGCIVISVLQHVIMALLIAAGVLLVWGVLFRPRQVLAFVTVCAVTSLVQSQPAAMIGFGVCALLLRIYNPPAPPTTKELCLLTDAPD